MTGVMLLTKTSVVPTKDIKDGKMPLAKYQVKTNDLPNRYMALGKV